MSAAALATLAIQLLPVVETGVTQLVSWIESLRAAAQQTGEWTAAQETAFRAALWAKTQDPKYKPIA
jgi:hypothetical protein